jgi:hypothetical protein
MREIRLLGSISGMWKRSYGSSIETPPDERGDNSRDELTAPPRHISTSHQNQVHSTEERRRRQEAVDYAIASVELSGLQIGRIDKLSGKEFFEN